MEIFRLKDYQDKNVLIIGNKPINWENTQHENVGGLEFDYLKSLINNNKIEYINL